MGGGCPSALRTAEDALRGALSPDEAARRADRRINEVGLWGGLIIEEKFGIGG